MRNLTLASTQPESATRRAKRQQRRSDVPLGPSTDGQSRPPKSKLREWLEALGFTLVVMLVVRTFFFDLFRIPTPSMEKTLLVGDYLFVSKLHYGVRTPISLGIPFTKIYVKGLTLPHTRLPGFTSIQRGDVVVFNYPPEDLPIDRKTHYIKRVIGLPGDTLWIQNKIVYVNGEPQPLRPTMQQLWRVIKTDPRVVLPEVRLRELGIEEIQPTPDPRQVLLVATSAAATAMASWPYVERIEPFVLPSGPQYSELMYPPGKGYSPDQYGPIIIPARGQTIALTEANWPIVEPVIRRYEGHTTGREPDGTFLIDGQRATTYTFTQDYYFVMGDNRDNSEDSRFWGFVPMDHIVGKALFVYFSWDGEHHLPRFERLFTRIH